VSADYDVDLIRGDGALRAAAQLRADSKHSRLADPCPGAGPAGRENHIQAIATTKGWTRCRFLILFLLGLSTSGAGGLASAAPHGPDAVYWSKGADDASAVQTKTVLLDIPEIAERVNKVVVNIRSLSDSGRISGVDS
jgi:hypothetical protein